MARSHLRHITLSKWFPGNDPIATVVARLCILREDYLLELQGLIKTDFNPFDVTPSVSKPDSLDGNSKVDPGVKMEMLLVLLSGNCCAGSGMTLTFAANGEATK